MRLQDFQRVKIKLYNVIRNKPISDWGIGAMVARVSPKVLL